MPRYSRLDALIPKKTSYAGDTFHFWTPLSMNKMSSLTIADGDGEPSHNLDNILGRTLRPPP